LIKYRGFIKQKNIGPYGNALKYASDRLRNNKKLVMQAFNTSPESVKFIGEELRQFLAEILRILLRKYTLIQFCSIFKLVLPYILNF
jgi:hypothetical protein